MAGHQLVKRRLDEVETNEKCEEQPGRTEKVRQGDADGDDGAGDESKYAFQVHVFSFRSVPNKSPIHSHIPM